MISLIDITFNMFIYIQEKIFNVTKIIINLKVHLLYIFLKNKLKIIYIILKNTFTKKFFLNLFLTFFFHILMNTLINNIFYF